MKSETGNKLNNSISSSFLLQSLNNILTMTYFIVPFSLKKEYIYIYCNKINPTSLQLKFMSLLY